jgi:hypothetical protein
MLLTTHGPVLTGTEEILFLVVAVAILAIGIFRFDWIFHSKKKAVEPHPAAKRAKRMIVEYHDDDDTESPHR